LGSTDEGPLSFAGSERCDVRFWHLADIDGQEEHVRY